MENKETNTEKIKQIVIFLKTNKWWIILVLIITTMIVNMPNKKVETKPSIAPSAKPVEIKDNYSYNNSDNPKRNDDQKTYSLNNFKTIKSIEGFNWQGNKIIYSTNDGIFSLWNNEKINSAQIQKVSFSKNGESAIYKTQNGVSYLNLKNNTTKNININSDYFELNNNGNYVLWLDNNSINTYNILNDQNKSIQIDNINNYQAKWINNQNKFYLYNKTSNEVNIYDYENQKLNIFKLEDGHVFKSINENTNIIVSLFNKDLYIKNIDTGQTKTSRFKESSKIEIYWKNSDDFLVLENINRGVLDLYDQFIWLLKSNGTKDYIGSSQPIPKKINLDLGLQINSDESAVILGENNGGLWIISLKPSVIPVYKNEGISFFKASGLTREDSH